MKFYRLINLVGYPIVIGFFILEAVGIIKTSFPFWVPTIAALLLTGFFLWLYIPIFRDEGWNTFKAIFERKPE